MFGFCAPKPPFCAPSDRDGRPDTRCVLLCHHHSFLPSSYVTAGIAPPRVNTPCHHHSCVPSAKGSQQAGHRCGEVSHPTTILSCRLQMLQQACRHLEKVHRSDTTFGTGPQESGGQVTATVKFPVLIPLCRIRSGTFLLADGSPASVSPCLPCLSTFLPARQHFVDDDSVSPSFAAARLNVPSAEPVTFTTAPKICAANIMHSPPFYPIFTHSFKWWAATPSSRTVRLCAATAATTGSSMLAQQHQLFLLLFRLGGRTRLLTQVGMFSLFSPKPPFLITVWAEKKRNFSTRCIFIVLPPFLNTASRTLAGRSLSGAVFHTGISIYSPSE